MATAGKTHQLLIQALSVIDRKDLANLWDCSLEEVSKKISGARNINIEDMAAALAMAGVQITTESDDRIIKVDELQALNLLANRYLNRRVNNPNEQ